MRILITGGAGFIGSALIRKIIAESNFSILNIDKLTYAYNINALDEVKDSKNYQFLEMDINDRESLAKAFQDFQPTSIMHLAAESHVDNSIEYPGEFVETNVLGTASMLIESHNYWKLLSTELQNSFRFLHISTDEVYGDLDQTGYFTENSPYKPSSPYSASKAGSDHLVRAWFRTYKFPTIITNCSNNFGPFQHNEKLIPKTINSIMRGESIPVYGDGMQIRDWLYVEDHVDALIEVLKNGIVGETYNIGCDNEKTNIELIKEICKIIDAYDEFPIKGKSSKDLIKFIDDRPGHDRRYAIDAAKIKNELLWQPKKNFEAGLRETIDWFYNNQRN